jgi:hypothetical protein
MANFAAGRDLASNELGGPAGGGNLFSITDAGELRHAAEQLFAFDPAIRTALRRRLRGAGQKAADAVRSAAAMWSTTIPAAVATTVNFTPKRAAVYVRVPGARMPQGKAPLPRMIEGQAGGRGYRHPVYGHDAWVEQTPHPYFYSTLAKQRPAVGEAIDDAVTDALRAVGLS